MEKPDMMKMFLELSDKAWSELMKQKIMAAYEKERGQNMDAMAQVAMEHGLAFWTAMEHGKQLTEEQLAGFQKRYADAMNL